MDRLWPASVSCLFLAVQSCLLGFCMEKCRHTRSAHIPCNRRRAFVHVRARYRFDQSRPTSFIIRSLVAGMVAGPLGCFHFYFHSLCTRPIHLAPFSLSRTQNTGCRHRLNCWRYIMVVKFVGNSLCTQRYTFLTPGSPAS